MGEGVQKRGAKNKMAREQCSMVMVRPSTVRVMASPALVELQPERADPATGEIELARYSTREMVEIDVVEPRRR